MSLNLQLILIAGSVLFLALTVYYIRRWGLDLYNSIRWFAGAVVLLLLPAVLLLLDKVIVHTTLDMKALR